MRNLMSLQALEPIETIEPTAPLNISLVAQNCGTAQQPDDVMAMRVKWANTARYKVLTRDIPQQFAPFNAVIRIIGTEDFHTDYLAVLAE